MWIKSTTSDHKQQGENKLSSTDTSSNFKNLLEGEMSLDQLFDPLDITPNVDKEAAGSGCRVSYDSNHNKRQILGTDGKEVVTSTGHGVCEIPNETNKTAQNDRLLEASTCYVPSPGEISDGLTVIAKHALPNEVTSLETLDLEPDIIYSPSSSCACDFKLTEMISDSFEPLVKTVETEDCKSIPEKNVASKKCTELITEKDRQASFCPVTMKLTIESIQRLLEVAGRESKGTFRSWQPFGVVGLHTCGDLASTSLRVFAQVPSARLVCVVGCCYHHITEIHEKGKVIIFMCILHCVHQYWAGMTIVVLYDIKCKV